MPGVLDQLRHDPLQRRGRGVRAAVEELGAQCDHLVVRQLAAAIVVEPDVNSVSTTLFYDFA